MKFRIIPLLLAGSVFTFAGSAQALPVFNAEVSVTGWNGVPDAYGFDYGADLATPSSASGGAQTAAISGAFSVAGLNASDLYDSMTFNYAGQAQSSLANGFKVQSYIDGTNLFWNPANLLFANSDGTVNAGGTPRYFDVSAVSNFSDSISLAGGATLSKVKFIFDIDGQFAIANGNNAYASLGFYGSGLGGPLQTIYSSDVFSAGGNAINTSVTSDYFSVVNGAVDVNFQLISDAWIRPLSSTPSVESAPYASASSNFFNTVKIAQILGFDSLGNQVNLKSAMASDGTQLSVASFGDAGAVPEPATWAMMIVGFGAIGAAMRGKKSAGAAALA